MKTFVLGLLVVAIALAAPSGKPQFKRGIDKIIGGTDVAPGEIPYQVSFQDVTYGDNFHFCAGIVYSEDWIITAGHCVYGKDNTEYAKRWRIVVGDHNLDIHEGTEQMGYVKDVILHEEFDTFNFFNDIALLKLNSSLILNEYVQPAPMPQQMQQSTGDAVVSGWGYTSEGSFLSDILQKVTVPIMSDEHCRGIYGDYKTGHMMHIYDSMICAGAQGLDSCQGDSGGPMTCTSGDTTYLCGIVSWGYRCALEDYPGVYTEVSYYIDWLHEHTGVVM